MKISFKILLLVIILSSSNLFAQYISEALKRQAITHMQNGKYGEAIDLLNKYITAKPQQAEGYNLRGLCREQRQEYEYSVLDFRRAIRLDPTIKEYQDNLNRVLSVWHQLLYKKIDGHKRDIAINPNNPYNYLEIGKSYRWLELWLDAETWYDEYIKRDDNASPDEILRYTEILAKNGSIVKGERILKKYVDRYPEDWRLWSRYGYFTMWLGKNNIAKNAFETALGFKPFFQEALDGLDEATKKGYLTQYIPRSYERVYPIDRFYAQIKKNPDDDNARFDLIEELMKANRFEEAYQQVQYLLPKYSEEERFQNVLLKVTTVRDSVYQLNIEKYTADLKQDPENKQTAMKLAESYANLFDYDNALEILDEYLQGKPEDQAPDVRYRYATYAAWNYEWEKAIAQLSILLTHYPDNIDYQLLRGQISVWTVLDLDQAEVYLKNVLVARPDNLNSMLALTSLYAWKKNFREAKKYLDRAERTAPKSPIVESVRSNYELHLSAYNELLIFQIKADAEKLAADGKCNEAIEKFKEYISKRTGINTDEKREYAGMYSCAQRYDEAIKIYDEILSEGFDYNIALDKAKNLLWNKDSTAALTELKSLYTQNPQDTETQLYLSDAFAANHELDSAYQVLQNVSKTIEDSTASEPLRFRMLYLADSYSIAANYEKAGLIYNSLLSTTQDSTEVQMLEQRIDWIPPSGLSLQLYRIGSFVRYFMPTNIGVAPFGSFYGDNQDFKLYNYGTRVDAGLLGYMAIGASAARVDINSKSESNQLDVYRGYLSFLIPNRLTLSGSYGQVQRLGENKQYAWDAGIRYQIFKDLNAGISYEKNDARLILYSPGLINHIFSAKVLRADAQYQNKFGFRISANYNYYDISDGDKGNDIIFRAGKEFFKNVIIGYEFYYSNYEFISQYYYSPQYFESHSLWGEYHYALFNKISGKVYGKIGYVPAVDFFISEILGEIMYRPAKYFSISGSLGYSNSFRYDSNYRSLSTSVSAYWSIF